LSGDVIVTITLNAALHVAYTAGDAYPAGDQGADGITAVSRPVYRAGGRGVTVARVLRAFGHDVLAAGLAGGASGELIVQDLARSGVPTAFTLIRGESRRFFRFSGPGSPTQRFSEPGPYITTEELGRFAADYRRLMAEAAAVVLCGSLPDGLDADTYGSLVTYAVEAGVPVILDAGGDELKHAVGHGPDLVVAESGAGPGDPAELGATLVRLGAGAAAVAAGDVVSAVAAGGGWTARVESPPAEDTAAVAARPEPAKPEPAKPEPAKPEPAKPGPGYAPARGALVAGLVPGQLLGWSWPDRLRHALALAAGGAGTWTREPGDAVERDRVDLAAYERLLDAVRVEPSSSRYFKE
jgi:pfkB family carbohydrate kinase